MNRSTLISLAGLAMAIALVAKGQSTRSMQPDEISPAKTSTGFDPAQSVALFVGARTFPVDNTLETVPYAVDDAVDLAYTFALDPRVTLVRPKRVVLALSDPTPSKPDSRRRLAELKKQGAVVVSADQSQILKLLNRQAGTVGAAGIFIVSFATHGFSDDGAQYLLAANSLLRERNTAIPAARIFDLVAQSNATRSLILIDACRERIRRKRAGEPEQLSAAPLMKRMALTEGQVVLYAAAAGKWAYDDDIRKNGVFTGAVLDGLQCRTGHDGSGMVTVDALSATVERNVLSWIRTNRDLSIRNATQISIDGAARMMPVAICSRPAPKLPEGIAPLVSGPQDPLANRRPLRQPMEHCQEDGKRLVNLYPSREPEQFVREYLGWRDGCVSVLRDLDRRLPQGKTRESETVRFLSIANFWCATKCPETLSPGNCAMFQEKSRAERCFWDLDKAVEEVDAIIVRNASALKSP
jgi:Caspase domain